MKDINPFAELSRQLKDEVSIRTLALLANVNGRGPTPAQSDEKTADLCSMQCDLVDGLPLRGDFIYSYNDQLDIWVVREVLKVRGSEWLCVEVDSSEDLDTRKRWNSFEVGMESVWRARPKERTRVERRGFQRRYSVLDHRRAPHGRLRTRLYTRSWWPFVIVLLLSAGFAPFVFGHPGQFIAEIGPSLKFGMGILTLVAGPIVAFGLLTSEKR